ncbi:hypothetical protein [Klebsiella pasteurii]|uniref:hypothetical protein n=1 Tax=Klebsiella pasteurii TaxID=2587529 RepID=UPI00237B5A32|nr:hypothetical protein [Klebsiella pasteurii]MDD9662548.1 hypothetical protein [Klebsiella pasteurii]MDD9670192.1 hypothetical protein [Klebsiella pasteurii]MDD9685530.1 hypothetical protein [Klebsiella pasteurii]
MKFCELPERLQEQAAARLSDELEGIVTWSDENRTEKAIAVAKSVREAFVNLASD